jgi:tol-pal system protein YbgF
MTLRFLGVALVLGGCAAGADVAGLATQEEVLRLRGDVTALQRSVLQARTQTEALSVERAREQSAQGDRQTQTLSQRIDRVTATLTALTSRVDELSARVETLGHQARPAPPRPFPPAAPPPAPPPSALSATPRPSTASTAAPARPAPATAAPASPPPRPTAIPAPSVARPATGAPQPQDIYQAAYIDFSKGSYMLAIDGFREFLRRYPEHPQANSAQYWIGESHVALAQQYANTGQADRVTEALQRAVQEFRKVVANYPRGDRTPTALYKEALTLIELKQPALAQARLQYLVDNFPQAEETPNARERLAALRQR